MAHIRRIRAGVRRPLADDLLDDLVGHAGDPRQDIPRRLIDVDPARNHGLGTIVTWSIRWDMYVLIDTRSSANGDWSTVAFSAPLNLTCTFLPIKSSTWVSLVLPGWLRSNSPLEYSSPASLPGIRAVLPIGDDEDGPFLRQDGCQRIVQRLHVVFVQIDPRQALRGDVVLLAVQRQAGSAQPVVMDSVSVSRRAGLFHFARIDRCRCG